jgi:hypothetical protein
LRLNLTTPFWVRSRWVQDGLPKSRFFIDDRALYLSLILSFLFPSNRRDRAA